MDAEENEHELHADLDGLVELPVPGTWFLAVAAPDHVRREFVGCIMPGELVLELEPAGIVEVEVRTESGKPLAGAEVLLVPPLQEGKPYDGDWKAWSSVDSESPKRHQARRHAAAQRQGTEWPIGFIEPLRAAEGLDVGGGRVVAARHSEAIEAHAWRTRTDEHGRARWAGLPPGPGYRVGWLGPERVAVEPHHELDPYAFEGGRWAVRGRAVEDVSASLLVHPEESARVTVTAFREASVYGWIDTGGAELSAPSVVKLFHCSTRSAPTASDLRLVLMETSVVPTLAGQFEIHGLKPGKKRIAAHWSARPGQISFASVEFEIAASESKDLGLLQPQPGYELTVRTLLRDAQARELAPSEVFSLGVMPEVALGIDTLSDPVGLPGAISELISIPLGDSIVLNGLPPGRAYLRAQLGDEYEFRSDVDVQLTKPRDRWVTCPSLESQELTFVASRFVEQRLRILWEGGGTIPRLEVHWRSPVAGLSGRTDLRPSRVATSTPEYRLMLAAGTYDLLVHAQTFEETNADTGWYWTGPLTVSDGAEVIELKLLRGCAIGGLLHDVGGAPLTSRALSFALPGWGTEASPAWTYRTMTDEFGRYRVSSLPPETAVRTSSGGLAVTTGAVGSERAIDLLDAR